MNKYMTIKQPIVTVFEYKDKVGICTLLPDSKLFVPNGGGRIGCVLLDASKLHISVKAIDILLTTKATPDDLGDFDFWQCNDGKWCFSWLGGIKRILTSDNEHSSSSNINMMNKICKIVPNDPTQEFMKAVDNAK